MRWMFYIGVLFVIIISSRIVLAGEWELQREYIDKSKIGNIKDVDLHGIYFIDENTGWAVGYCKLTPAYGIILKTVDGGKKWSDISPRTHPPKNVLPEDYYWMSEVFYSVFFIDEKNGWVVGTRSTIIKTSDGGDSWTKVNFDKTKYGVWRDIYMYKEGATYKGFLIGGEYQSGTYGYMDNQGNKLLNKGYVYMYTHNADATFELADTKIFGDNDYSKHLTSLTSGAIDSQRIFCLAGYNYEGKNSSNNYGIVYCFNNNTPPLANKKEISPKKKGSANKEWSLACYQDIEMRNNHIWVVGTDNTIIFSKDNGNSWKEQKYEKGSKKNLNKVFFVTNNIGWTIGTTGGIYTTLNGGETWSKDSISSNYSSIKFGGVYFPSFKVGWIAGQQGTILKYTQSADVYPIKNEIFSYPNPFIPNDNQDSTGSYSRGITIENLSPGSKVKIYTTSGDFVKETSNVNSYGVTNWKIDESLAAGLYLLIGKDSNGKVVTGKVVIIK